MPFKSEAQRKWMYANNPKLAEKFQSGTPESSKLPERLGAKSDSEKRKLARQQYSKRKSQQINKGKKLTTNKLHKNSSKIK